MLDDFGNRGSVPPQTPVPSELRTRPFLLSEAVRAGLSRQMLRGKRFRQLLRCVYVAAEVPDGLETRVDAVRLVLPGDAVLSHYTAALLRGLPVPATEQVHATVGPSTRGGRVAGVCVHLGAPPAVGHDGRPLSTPSENFLELAETLSLVDLVILGDAMVRRGFVTCEELLAAAATTRRRRGVRMAREAAALVRPRVDSPMETRVRLLLVFAGLPEPRTNLVVRDEHGGWIGEVDLAYAAYMIAIEYHGDVHRAKPRQWRSDIAKVELLTQLGWRVIVLTSDDVFVHPDRMLWRVHEALVKAARPAVPRDLDPGWRQHFTPRWMDAHHDQLRQAVHDRAVT